MKKIIMWILVFLLICYVINLITYELLNYVFVHIMDECLKDEYWVDCSWPVTKSMMISYLISPLLWLLFTYLGINKIMVLFKIK